MLTDRVPADTQFEIQYQLHYLFRSEPKFCIRAFLLKAITDALSSAGDTDAGIVSLA
jgi:hypothetical protein